MVIYVRKGADWFIGGVMYLYILNSLPRNLTEVQELMVIKNKVTPGIENMLHSVLSAFSPACEMQTNKSRVAMPLTSRNVLRT